MKTRTPTPHELAAAAWVRRLSVRSSCRADRGFGRLRPFREPGGRRAQRLCAGARGLVDRPQRRGHTRPDRHRPADPAAVAARGAAQARARVPGLEAPSRFRTALHAGTTADLEGRLEQAKQGADGDTPVEAAERLLGFVAALSMHDRVTRGHSERVRAYSQMVAKELHLGRAEVDRLNWAALLHDIGKLGGPRRRYSTSPASRRRRNGSDSQSPRVRRPTCGAVARVARGVDGCRLGSPRALGRNGYPNGTAGEDLARRPHRRRRRRVRRHHLRAFLQGIGHGDHSARGDRALRRDQFDPRVVRAFLSISLGRLRLAMGPLSWLAQAPVLGRIPLGPGMATAVSSAVAVVGALAAGLVSGPHVPTQLAPPAAAAGSPSVQVASGGRLAEAARVLPGRRGGKARTPAPAPVAAPVSNELLAALPVPAIQRRRKGRSPRHPPRPHPATGPARIPAARRAARPAGGPGGPVVCARRRSERQRGRGTAARPCLADEIRGRGVTFSASADNSALFRAGAEPALDADGTLSYIPAADASGTAHVTIRALAGDGGRSRPATLTITVAPVNDAPGFTAGADQTVTEDSGCTASHAGPVRSRRARPTKPASPCRSPSPVTTRRSSRSAAGRRSRPTARSPTRRLPTRRAPRTLRFAPWTTAVRRPADPTRVRRRPS